MQSTPSARDKSERVHGRALAQATDLKGRLRGATALLALCILAGVTCARCGIMQSGDKFYWQRQLFLVTTELAHGTPISCDLGHLTYRGTRYGVCRLRTHEEFVDSRTIVLHAGYGYLLAWRFGVH